ncbi:DUF2589 domain-containing protein [Burkholderia ubonensis]|uniref:DUF2589 domain-containing protein n=2 Tax=Burkholderia ubonensis TaxID=101571 RepID=UPI000A57390B|nr:DUF2589 domain-containing protein [Burkholderia ubonensis]
MFRLFKRRRDAAARDDRPAADAAAGGPSDAGEPPPSPASAVQGGQPGATAAPFAAPEAAPAVGASSSGTANGTASGTLPDAAPGTSPGPASGASDGHACAPPPDAPPPAPPAGSPPGEPADADRPPPRGLALDEIARGMQHAAAAANQLLAHQYTAVLDQFFDRRDDGLLAPREVQVALDAEHTMPVPLVALATPRGLALERMVVHLTVRGDFTEAHPAGAFAGDDQRGRFYVTLAPRSANKDAQGNAGRRDTEHIDIEMQFAALAPPEAIMRVIDEYTHRLVPRARHGNEEHHDGEPA